MRLYEKCCHLLDVTMDWELRSLLGHDNISVLNRSLNFNHIYAFSTAIQANLQSLILSSVGLTPRSISILCQGLKKCIHLNLLVSRRIDTIGNICSPLFGTYRIYRGIK